MRCPSRCGLIDVSELKQVLWSGEILAVVFGRSAAICVLRNSSLLSVGVINRKRTQRRCAHQESCDRDPGSSPTHQSPLLPNYFVNIGYGELAAHPAFAVS